MEQNPTLLDESAKGWSPSTRCHGLRTTLSLLLSLTVTLSHAEDSGWEVYRDLGDRAAQSGNLAEAEAMYTKSLQLSDKSLEHQDVQIGELLAKLGELYVIKKEYVKAESPLKRSLDNAVWNLGASDIKLVPPLNRLATCYLYLPNGWPIAQALYYRALNIIEVSLGPDHPDVADALHRFALSLDYPYGRLPSAISLLERALAIREKSLGMDHLKVADTLSTLGFIYDLHGDYTTAKPLYERALTIQESNLGPTEPKVLQTLHNLGMLYILQRDTVNGDLFFQQAITKLEKILGSDHPEVGKVVELYASLLKNVGRQEEAETLLKRAEEISAKSMESSKP